jgi:hypothetical protein
MKKLIFLLLCGIAISTSVFSQTFRKVATMNAMSYNRIKKDWVVDKSYSPSNLAVLIKGSEIIIANEYEQRIYTYGDCEKDTYDTHVVYSWPALDKDGKKCKFMIKNFFSGTTVYTFLYDELAIEYIME